ncbi:MAG: T9SS type A sorting domain-containing protein [Ignavibacteriae bacterium]|nr:T9SS type A sorting domain-containing protein [Ignavibacteriota bacterium]
MKVFDILGREVVTIINNEIMEEGEHEIELDASNYGSGVYFYRLEANGTDEDGIKGNFMRVRKMVLLR